LRRRRATESGGIGLGASDEKAAGPDNWRGQNLLGFALMEVRHRLQ
jgi:hypothetical protein